MTAMNQLGPQRDQRFLLVATLLLGFATSLQPGQAPHAAICQNCEATPVPDVPTYIPPPPPMVALQFDQCIFSDYSVFSMVMDKPAFTNVVAGTANGVFKQMRNALGVYDHYQTEANRTDREPFLHPALWPNLDIRIEDCVQQDAGGYGTNVAVWFEQPGYYGSSDTTESRNWWAKNMNYREVNNQSGQVGIHIDDRALQSMLSIAKAYGQRQIDKQVKGSALENKVKIRGSTITYNDTTKKITTRVDARIDGILTGEYTNFWAVMNDQLSITERYVGYGQAPWFNDYVSEAWCSGTSKVDYDGSVDTFVANIVLNVADPIITAFNNGQPISINNVLNKSARMLQGPGCHLAKPFTARQFLVPNTDMKLVLDFPVLQVQGGVTVLGRYALAWRNMSVSINGLAGPGILYADPNEQPEGQFYATPRDLDSFLTYTWEAPGAIIAQPNAQSTKIRWPITVTSGQQVSKTVKVTVRDGSGHVVSKQESVLIRSSDTIPETDCVKYICD